MNKVKVPFPKYLNSKKLFYKWEIDVATAVGLSGMSIFMVLLWFGINMLLDMGISVLVAWLVSKQYTKFFKKQRKGYLIHLLYSRGFVNPNSTKKNEEHLGDLIPRGFENEFID